MEFHQNIGALVIRYHKAVKGHLKRCIHKQFWKLTDQIFNHLNQKEPLEEVARDGSRGTGLTPGQVVKYVIAVVQQQRQPAQPPTFGFPVQPVAPGPVPAEPIPLEPLPESQ